MNTYTKTEIDTQLTDYTSVTYLQDNYMTTLSLTETLMNKFASISLLDGSFYDKAYLDNQFSLKADVSELTSPAATDYLELKFTNSVDLTVDYYKKADIDNMRLSYSTGSYVDYTFHNKTDTDTLLADELTNIGDISLPGMLDIGASGYTNSRIICNANVNGYTGYAGLRAASSYGMYLNLSTTRTDGGWMYFKINNDDYMQLSGSENKINIYKDTSISSNLTVNGDLDSSKKFPLDIKNSTIHTEFWTLASFHQGIANSGSWLQFSRDGTSNTWQAGMPSDSSYVIRASDATNRLIVNQNGDTSISGNLDVGPVAIDAGSYTMGKISVGDTTAYESFNGNVNGFNLSLQTQMSFVACATNTDPTVNHIGLCCLNRASTYSS